MITTPLAPLVALALFVSFGAQEPVLDPLPEPDPEITAADLRHHLAILADDAMEGREAGTPGAVRAARYLARALEQAGAKPAGDDGTFFQAVPFQRVEHERAPVLIVTPREGEPIEAVYGRDFTALGRGLQASTKRLALRTVRALEDLPEEASEGEALWLDGNGRERREWLATREMGDGGGWGLVVRTGSRRPGQPVAPRGSRLTLGGPEQVRDHTVVTLRAELREKLEAGEIVALELRSFAKVVACPDFNVLGRIAGVGTAERPELADEVIAFSAHFDHLGVRERRGNDAEDADLVFNGADDDASGVAAVLELAEAFAAGPPPARTLLFCLVTGEEKGILGSKYYMSAPAEPLAQMVLELNIEMIGRPDELAGGSGKAWLTGFERTNLGEAFRAAGFAVEADPRPQNHYFERSDNYPFALEGIVAHSLSSYGGHEDYHRVTDELDTLDFAHFEAVVRGAYPAIRTVADGIVDPAWKPGGRPGE